ncbi:hypothetical protein H0X06_04885 [Candidatus Dependentiae bacterium]|nr:hypothetical protein [Candidatus Dependentiae bacterium]
MSIAGNTPNEKKLYAGMGLLLASSIIGAGYLGYSWYKKNKEQAAYKDLSESIEGYIKASTSALSSKKSFSPQWTDVQRAFKIGAEINSSSSLYPYFLAYQADVLLQQGQNTEAIQIMDDAIAHLDRTHPLYYLYALKNALMKTDSQDASLSQAGREALEKLANDNANLLQDRAQYYSALDAYYRGDSGAAQKRFQQIIARGNVDSPWHQKALKNMG